MSGSHRAAFGLVIGITVASTAWSVAHAGTTTTTVPAAVDRGEVAVVEPDDHSHPVTEGGSATSFTLVLPDGAACPGDTFNDQWRVQGFLVPREDDPANLKFAGNKPEGDGRWGLYQTDGQTYVQVPTAQNDAAGQPGRVLGIPSLSFEWFDLDYLPAGKYRMGLACSLFQDPGPYWDTEVEIVADPADSPGKFTWRMLRAADPSLIDYSESSVRRWVLIGSSAVLAGSLLALTLLRPRRKRQLTPRSLQ
jgi:hypothetical protein